VPVSALGQIGILPYRLHRRPARSRAASGGKSSP
jgi:hypothetical protein